MAVSDEALLAGMAVGDEDAAVTFVRRYQKRVYGLALSMVGDPVAAEDIAQEAFLRAWRHAPVFDRRLASVPTWVLTITRHLAIDFLRLRRADCRGPGDEVWLGLSGEGRSPDELAELADTRARLVKALSALPPEQARCLVLAAVYGYSAAEVSQALGIPLGTAKTRIRRGLMKLRDLFVEAGTPGAAQ
jgi:RNA polymerase sigma-70 factor (ECF subfamily)